VPSAEVPPPPPARPTEPVRDVTLRLSADSQHVDVKLIDRGGELQVAVHSADPALTTDLRASVRELVGGLEKSGFRAETWQPSDTPRHNAEATPATTRDAGDPPQFQSGEDPRRQGRNAYQEQAPARRGAAAGGESSSWIEQIRALIGAQKDN
jgi:hypothetical protein